MDNPTGRVLAVDLTKVHPSATVEVLTTFNCARCASGKGCGAGLFGTPGGDRSVEARIPPDVTVHVGDDVEIEMAPNSLLRAALIVYGMPLGGALLGAGIAYAAGLTDLESALAGFVGIAAGFLLARRLLGDCEFTPTIVGTLQEGC